MRSPEPDDFPDEPEVERLPVSSGGAIEAVTRGEVDIQVSTARRFPRDVATFKKQAMALACLDQTTAESCRYVLKREGKQIEGPSVRMAEIVASTWGNLRCESRIVGEDDEFITAQATAWDMERNVLIRMEVRRRITYKNGKKYSEDMRAVTGNAASSIALRNAILRAVPAAFVRPIYEQVCKVVMGDIKSLVDRRTKALQWFAARGGSVEMVLAFLGRTTVEEINLEDMATLNGVRTAITEGTSTIEDALAPDSEPEEPKPRTAAERRKRGPAHADEPAAAEPHDAQEELVEEAARAGLFGREPEEGQEDLGEEVEGESDEEIEEVIPAKGAAAPKLAAAALDRKGPKITKGLVTVISRLVDTGRADYDKIYRDVLEPLGVSEISDLTLEEGRDLAKRASEGEFAEE